MTGLNPVQKKNHSGLEELVLNYSNMMNKFTHTPSGYLVSIIFLSGLSPSGATLEIIINIEPVASVGRIAGNTSGLKKRNSSQTTKDISAPTPLND